MPTLGFHVSEDSDLKRDVEEHAKRGGHPSTSAYVRSLVLADIHGEQVTAGRESTILDVSRASVMVDLAHKMLGSVDAQEMKHAVGDLNQRAELKSLLTRYIAEHSGKHKPVHDRISKFTTKH